VQELRKMVEHFLTDGVGHGSRPGQRRKNCAVPSPSFTPSACQFTRRWTTAQIQVAVRVDANAAVVDFTGTPAYDQQIQRPTAVCTAAVLYVFRTLK
jgi:N-methylhydantoinase B/oxoprolinase/acetone carboxylase alpha subunit